MTVPNFNGDNEQAKAERRKVLERLPEKMQVEQQADFRKTVEAAQRRGAPPQHFEPRCKVCVNPHRNWIELMVAKGYSNSAIERAFEGSEDPVPRRSVAEHSKKHMNLEDTAMRTIIEYEAELEGKLHQEGVVEILTKRSMLEVLARKGFDDVISGNVTVEPRDMIQIVRVMADMDTTAGSAAVEEARLQVQIMTEAIQKAFPDRDDQAKLVREIKKLKAQYGLDEAEKLLEAPETIVDAEVVHS